MVGAFAVGKTSLVKRFVESLFSEKYHTTIGVKIDKKVMERNNKVLQMMIWDIEGVDVFTDLKASYLRGASGIMLVVDGTRLQTFESAERIKQLVVDVLGDVPILLLVNKSDLEDEWQIAQENIHCLGLKSESIFLTSAKTGENVEKCFEKMADLLLM